MRTIIIGDIHACHEELEELLAKAEVSAADRVVSVGDLVSKGPSTVKTLDIFMTRRNFSAVMGNHDYYLVKNWEADCLEELSGSHRRAVEEMGPDREKYMKFLKSLPFYLEMPHVTVVHAGFRPGLALSKQDPHDLIHLRTLEDGTPWYEQYQGKKLVGFGHWARQGLVVRKNAIGLDTGCVYGGSLTACILPERKIVSVKAKKVYTPVSGDGKD